MSKICTYAYKYVRLTMYNNYEDKICMTYDFFIFFLYYQHIYQYDEITM